MVHRSFRFGGLASKKLPPTKPLLDQGSYEQARQDELDKLKEEVKAQYAAEEARDEEWSAEGAAWFYSHAYSTVGWSFGPSFLPGSFDFHHHSSHRF